MTGLSRTTASKLIICSISCKRKKIKSKGRSVNYFNDLLKAYKLFFRYAFDEGYIETLVTEKIKNAKNDKVISRTFSDCEIKRLINFYSGAKYLDVHNKTMLLMFVEQVLDFPHLTLQSHYIR